MDIYWVYKCYIFICLVTHVLLIILYAKAFFILNDIFNDETAGTEAVPGQNLKNNLHRPGRNQELGASERNTNISV